MRYFMTQASEALPLYWGLAPEDKAEDIVKAFRHTLEQEGAFVSGEIGLPYIIQTAREYGMNDLIAKFITKRGTPKLLCIYPGRHDHTGRILERKIQGATVMI